MSRRLVCHSLEPNRKCGSNAKNHTNGCNGNSVEKGFTYVRLNGLVKEADYPYTSGKPVVCKIT